MKKIIWICFLMGLSSSASAEIQTQQQSATPQVQRPMYHHDTHINPPTSIASYAQKYANLQPVDGKRPNDPNLIQLALLLDTSNSMDGLINQAKSQLWMIVNELAHAHKNDRNIRLEVALYEYGNDSLSLSTGYIRQVTAFSENLDLLSEALFSLSTNGGSEYCGHVIAAGINGLKWNRSKKGLKMTYIAGNEPFNQGEVHFRSSCELATQQNIIINTIHCGDNQTGIRGLWQQGATLGHGQYFSIDSDRVTAGIASPYDDDLIALNENINNSYVPYGHEGRKSLKRQSMQDQNAITVSKATSASRAASKGSALYKNSNWDLVDAVEEKKIDIKNIDRKQLSQELQQKTDAELKSYIQNKKEERAAVKKKIAQLSEKRASFIASERSKQQETQSLGSAIQNSIRQQAEKQGFRFK
ncbi:MAG: hypothetical protein Q9M28_10440 [Mariprofundaceae bacterium]|nr:hypothetical protein [Mariprofundaceae bacterium]